MISKALFVSALTRWQELPFIRSGFSRGHLKTKPHQRTKKWQQRLIYSDINQKWPQSNELTVSNLSCIALNTLGVLFSSIAYLLMNDKEISMRLSIHPYTNYNEVQLVSSSNPLFTWKTSAHTSFLRSVPLNVSTHYTIAGRGSIVSLKAQIHCTWKSKWNSGTDSQTTAPSLFQFTDNVHNFSA